MAKDLTVGAPIEGEILGIPQKKKQDEVKNTTSLKSFHYREDGSVSFSVLETKYTTKVLEPKVYNLTAGVVDGNWTPVLRVSRDVERFVAI